MNHNLLKMATEDFNLFMPSISGKYSNKDIRKELSVIGEIASIHGKPLEHKESYQCVRVYIRKWFKTELTADIKESILGETEKFHFYINDGSGLYWVLTKHRMMADAVPAAPKINMNNFPKITIKQAATSRTVQAAVAPTKAPLTMPLATAPLPVQAPAPTAATPMPLATAPEPLATAPTPAPAIIEMPVEEEEDSPRTMPEIIQDLKAQIVELHRKNAHLENSVQFFRIELNYANSLLYPDNT